MTKFDENFLCIPKCFKNLNFYSPRRSENNRDKTGERL